MNMDGQGIKWEDFVPSYVGQGDYEDTNIICPNCGAFLKRYTKIVLASYPPKYRYDCLSCGWFGTK